MRQSGIGNSGLPSLSTTDRVLDRRSRAMAYSEPAFQIAQPPVTSVREGHDVSVTVRRPSSSSNRYSLSSFGRGAGGPTTAHMPGANGTRSIVAELVVTKGNTVSSANCCPFWSNTRRMDPLALVFARRAIENHQSTRICPWNDRECHNALIASIQCAGVQTRCL